MLLVLFQGFQPNTRRDQCSSRLGIEEAEREGVGEARRKGERVLEDPHAHLSRPSAYGPLESSSSFSDWRLWTSQAQLGAGFPNLQVLLKSINLIVKVNPHLLCALNFKMEAKVRLFMLSLPRNLPRLTQGALASV